jgi:hypothetical protein
VLGLLWFTPLIVSDRFVSRDFIGVAEPFVESALGPLGPWFMLYIAASAVAGILLWLRSRNAAGPHRIVYLAGLVFWLALGIHDALAVLGLPTFQYVMEYGFLGFSCAVLWAAFDNYTDQMAQDKYRVITEFATRPAGSYRMNRRFCHPAATLFSDSGDRPRHAGFSPNRGAGGPAQNFMKYYGDMLSAGCPSALIFRIVPSGTARSAIWRSGPVTSVTASGGSTSWAWRCYEAHGTGSGPPGTGRKSAPQL